MNMDRTAYERIQNSKSPIEEVEQLLWRGDSGTS